MSYTTKIIPETIKQKTIVDKTFCDICKKEIKKENFADESKVRINATLGAVYPEGDCRDGYIIDCCPECFLEKVKPLIEKTFDIEFREIDVEDNKFEDFYGY